MLTLAALVAGWLAGMQLLVMVVLWSMALYFYSSTFKTRFLLGNLTVSVVSSSGFVAGAWLAGRPAAGIAPMVLAFFLLMGREIVKDVEDLPGDQAHGATTLARRLGARRALGVAFVCFVLFAALLPWPYWLELCGPSYLWVVIFGVLPTLSFAMFSMFRDTSPANLVRVSWILKFDMFVGALGFYLGQA